MEDLDNNWILLNNEVTCDNRDDNSPATLGLKNMRGVFIVVGVGIVGGLGLIVIEIVYKKHQIRKQKRVAVARLAATRWRTSVERQRTAKQFTSAATGGAGLNNGGVMLSGGPTPGLQTPDSLTPLCVDTLPRREMYPAKQQQQQYWMTSGSSHDHIDRLAHQRGGGRGVVGAGSAEVIVRSGVSSTSMNLEERTKSVLPQSAQRVLPPPDDRPRSALSLGNRKPSSPVKMHRGDSNHALTEPEMGPEEEDDDDEEEEDEEDEEEEEDASRECGAGSRPTVIYANPPTKARSKKQRAAVAAHYGPPTGPLPPLPQHMGAQPPPKRRQAHSQQDLQMFYLHQHQHPQYDGGVGGGMRARTKSPSSSDSSRKKHSAIVQVLPGAGPAHAAKPNGKPKAAGAKKKKQQRLQQQQMWQQQQAAHVHHAPVNVMSSPESELRIRGIPKPPPPPKAYFEHQQQHPHWLGYYPDYEVDPLQKHQQKQQQQQRGSRMMQQQHPHSATTTPKARRGRAALEDSDV